MVKYSKITVCEWNQVNWHENFKTKMIIYHLQSEAKPWWELFCQKLMSRAWKHIAIYEIPYCKLSEEQKNKKNTVSLWYVDTLDVLKNGKSLNKASAPTPLTCFTPNICRSILSLFKLSSVRAIWLWQWMSS